MDFRLKPLMVFLAFVALNTIWQPSYGDSKIPRAQTLRAAYILNFAKFVEWPEPRLNHKFSLCVLENKSFGTAFAKMLNGKVVQGRKIKVRQATSMEALDSCHILYIPSSQYVINNAILKKLQDSSVLTVGESNEFVRQGGLIAFSASMEDSKFRQQYTLRFMVNPIVVERSNLKISSQLLKLATIIRD